MDNHASTAESILAQAQAAQAEPEGAPAEEANSTETVEAAPESEAPPEAEKPARRSISWEEAVKQVPPDIAKLMREMRADYTKKTQKISEERKGWNREREALMDGLSQLKDYKKPEGEYDPFNEESMQSRIEAEVATRLRAVLEPMQRKVATMKAEEGYQGFLNANPDFKTDQALRKDVQDMLEKNKGLDLETAYYAAKGKQAKAQIAVNSNARVARRNAAREAAMKGTAASRRPPISRRPQKADLKGMSAADIYRLAQSMHEK